MSECIFCDIVAGKVPAEKVYEDSSILAFNDINPQAPIHILIVPKDHIGSVVDIDNNHIDILGKLILAAKKVAENQNIAEKGFRIIVNSGKDGGQLIEHLHLHLLGGKHLGPKIVV